MTTFCGLIFFLLPEKRRDNRGISQYNLQSRAQAEEIESSSRYSETENTIFANTNFLIPGPESYSMEAVIVHPV